MVIRCILYDIQYLASGPVRWVHMDSLERYCGKWLSSPATLQYSANISVKSVPALGERRNSHFYFLVISWQFCIVVMCYEGNVTDWENIGIVSYFLVSLYRESVSVIWQAWKLA